MKIAAIMPVKGREALLFHTVNRLTTQGIACFCVGHTISERVVVEMAGGDFTMVKESDYTIAGKWQLALDKARKMKPDAVLYMGSGDLVSRNWCKTLYKDLEQGYAMTGTRGIYFLDIRHGNHKRLIWWGGYMEDRSTEPIGTGRLFSSRVLDMMNWKLFDTTLNGSIDYCQMVALNTIAPMWPKDKLVCFNTSNKIACLSTSTYRWPNKHDFQGEMKYPTAKVIQDVDKVLSLHFKELINLFNE